MKIKIVWACGDEVTEKDTAKPYDRFKTVLLSNGVPEASLQQDIHEILSLFEEDRPAAKHTCHCPHCTFSAR
jgi:hypothetical protein